MGGFKRGDRVRDINHEWTPDRPEFGTVTVVHSNGNVDVDWDGEGVGLYAHTPESLAHVK
jgi:hypothetical protein